MVVLGLTILLWRHIAASAFIHLTMHYRSQACYLSKFKSALVDFLFNISNYNTEKYFCQYFFLNIFKNFFCKSTRFLSISLKTSYRLFYHITKVFKCQHFLKSFLVFFVIAIEHFLFLCNTAILKSPKSFINATFLRYFIL